LPTLAAPVSLPVPPVPVPPPPMPLEDVVPSQAGVPPPTPVVVVQVEPVTPVVPVWLVEVDVELDDVLLDVVVLVVVLLVVLEDPVEPVGPVGLLEPLVGPVVALWHWRCSSAATAFIAVCSCVSSFRLMLWGRLSKSSLALAT
jgi:hypothetical protein